MPVYDLQILDGVGWANGVNDSAAVVGVTINFHLLPHSLASWWTPPNYHRVSTMPGPEVGSCELLKIDNAGDAIGLLPAPGEININTQGIIENFVDDAG